MKNYIVKTVLAILVLSALSACTTLPPPESFDLKNGARIGVITNIAESIEHKHFGAWGKTSNKVYDESNWALNDYMHSEFKRVLSQNGYEYVRLSQQELDEKGIALSRLFVVNAKQWALAPNAESSIDYLRDELKLDAVINYQPNAYSVRTGCSAGGCNERRFTNPGLYSISNSAVFTIDEFFAVLPFRKNMVILDPITNVAKPDYIGSHDSLTAALAGRLDPHRRTLKKFKLKDKKTISKEKLSRIRSEVKKLITDNVERDVNSLSSK